MTPTDPNALTTQLVAILTPLLIALVTTLVGVGIAALNKWQQKIKQDLEAGQFAKQRDIATAAVLATEEDVEHRLKAGGFSTNAKAQVKTDQAVSLVQSKLPGVDGAEAELLVKEAVARTGLGASNSLPIPSPPPL